MKQKSVHRSQEYTSRYRGENRFWSKHRIFAASKTQKAMAVSRQPLTAEARVQSHTCLCET
jgi:hypothetical protein